MVGRFSKNKIEPQKISFNITDEEAKLLWELAKKQNVRPATIAKQFFDMGVNLTNKEAI